MTARMAVLLLVAFGTSVEAREQGKAAAPSYTPASIVNWTTNQTGPFAPGVIVTLYGTDLAYGEAQAASLQNVALPTTLAGVKVVSKMGAAQTAMPLYYVSSTQINFVLPMSMDAGKVDVQVVRDSLQGPAVSITLDPAAPALLQCDAATTRAVHADGQELSAEKPGAAGEVIVLYATGLGPPRVRLDDGAIPQVPKDSLAPLIIQGLADLRVLLNGEAVDSARILYAGLAPGLPGLYQINVQLPDRIAPDPEIRLALGERLSPAGLKLPAR